MFNHQKFLTRGIESEIPAWLVHLMWHMVLMMEVSEKDYLQVFTLTKNTDWPTHRPRAGAAAVPLRARCTV